MCVEENKNNNNYNVSGTYTSFKMTEDYADAYKIKLLFYILIIMCI